MSRTKALILNSPNNPTGAAASLKDLLLIAEFAPDAALLVDEAYFEFHGETLLPEWRTRPNVFAESFSRERSGLRAEPVVKAAGGELLGGTLTAGPTDGGFRVELWVPA